MADTFRIHRGSFVTTLVDSQDHLRYSIESNTSDDGNRSSMIRTVAQKRSYTGDSPDFWYDEIARIDWRFQATSVVFGKSVVKVSTFLRNEKPFYNSRVFMGPGELPLRWIKGRSLELRHQNSDALVARILPPCNRLGLFTRKPRITSLEVLPRYAKEPRFLNTIVITWTIIDGLMRDNDLNCSV